MANNTRDSEDAGGVQGAEMCMQDVGAVATPLRHWVVEPRPPQALGDGVPVKHKVHRLPACVHACRQCNMLLRAYGVLSMLQVAQGNAVGFELKCRALGDCRVVCVNCLPPTRFMSMRASCNQHAHTCRMHVPLPKQLPGYKQLEYVSQGA